jgi:uncharacterized protein (TIGR03790 family)
MKSRFALMLLGAILPCATLLAAANRGDEVVVVYNTSVPESKEVAQHYALLRDVPTKQVLGFPMPAIEEISRTDFSDTIQKPLSRALANQNLLRFGSKTVAATNGRPEYLAQRVTAAKIRYLVLCYGVPLRISDDRNLVEPLAESLRSELQHNGAAVDSELACLPLLDQHFLLAGPSVSRLYGCTNAGLLNPTNGLLMVARLDGPTPAIARDLVNKAILAERDGLWGNAYFDLRGLTNGDYKRGDDYLRNAADNCRRFGFDAIVDYEPRTFPAAFPMSQIAFYAGWYDEHVSGPFTRSHVEFMPGAFAYHLHSFSAATLRSTDRQWVGPLLAKGATVTMGSVAEPYLGGTPDIGTFAARFLFSGFTFGEAAYASQPVLSWQITVVGDPLYQPFARSPLEMHTDLERRHSPLLEWSYVRVSNYRLAHGTPMAQICLLLENLDLTKHSAVLQERLAEFYDIQGKPSSCIHAIEQALKFDPSPQQRVRLMLRLGERLAAANRNRDACDVYRQFLKDCPDYPDLSSIQRSLDDLTQKVAKSADTSRSTNRPSFPPVTSPPPRHGI